MANQVDGLADYSSLNGVLANSKLAGSNPSAYQLLKGLISNAQKSNDFLNSQFTDINGQQTSLQNGIQSALDGITGINGTISGILSTIATIQADITAIAAILADRNNANYGCYGFASGVQTLTTGVSAAMTMDTTLFGSMRSGNVMVAPVAAQYIISGQVIFAPAAATGTRKVEIATSGGLLLSASQMIGHPTDNVIAPFTFLLSLGTNETVQVNLTQDSGGNINAQGAMQIVRVSYT